MDKCGKVSGRLQAKSVQALAPEATQKAGESGISRAVSACSACAGDYEDPDRTAGARAESEDDETREWDAREDELLAEE